MHPVGPRSAGVYWIRRGLVGLVAVAVVAAVVWFVVGRGNGPQVDPAADSLSGGRSSQMTGVLATDSSSSAAPSTSPTSDGHGTGSAKNTTTGSTAGTTATATDSTAGKADARRTGSTKNDKKSGDNKSGDKNGSDKNGSDKNGSDKNGSDAKATDSGTKKSTDSAKDGTDAKATGKKAKQGTKEQDSGATKTGTTAATKTGATSAGTSGAASTTTVPTTKTVPTTTPPPKPSYDDQGRLLCPDDAIAVKATTGRPSYPAGSQPILGMTVTNTGSKSCVRDLSGPLQVYTVFSKAGTRTWSTADCFPGQGSDIRELAPGQTVSYNIKWSGTTSTPGCATPRVPVKPGDYTLVAALGKLKSAPKPFAITG